MAASTRSIACAPAGRPPRASKSSSRRSCRQDRRSTPARCTRTIPSGRARSATGHRNGSTAADLGSRGRGRSSAHAPALVSLDSAGTVPKRSNDACINFSPLPTWRFSRGGRGALRASGAPTPAPARNRHWPHGGAPAVRLRNPFGRKPKEFPSHLWTQCPSCGEMLFNKQLERNHNVCQKCGHDFKFEAAGRVELLADARSFTETDADIVSSDPLGFVDSKPYPERIAAAQAKTGHKDAVLTGDATISAIPIVLAVMDFEFMGGSMGSVVGEKLTRAAERAFAERKPLVIVSASGGARMQEGTIALMQLAKTVAALARLDEARIPFISVLTDPTTGGVLASFASLGDIVLAEPGALIGFSGARVTSETIGEKLPKGFQRAEFLLEHGFVDQVVPRPQLKERIAFFLNSFRIAGQDLRWSL